MRTWQEKKKNLEVRVTQAEFTTRAEGMLHNGENVTSAYIHERPAFLSKHVPSQMKGFLLLRYS